MRIAYLINQYPKVSHTFIRREILALERQGFEVTRISLRGWDIELVDKEDELERQRTRYVLRDGSLPLVVSLLRFGLTRPVRFIEALALAWRMGRHAERPLPVHLVYLAEACRIAGWLKSAKIQHLHAHFGTNSAEVAMLVNALGGPNWSFTVHGPEEFDKPQLIGLPEKIRRATFVVAISSFGRSQLFRWVDHEYWGKINVVRSGLEPQYYADAPNHSSSRNLVCVGRLCEQKGQLLLVEAVRRLLARGTDLHLTLAGDGELRPSIESFIKKHKLETNIRITGWINGDQVRRELLGARALVLPSFAEGLPVVIMEAMALRRPVISTFIAGIPELVDNEQGWLVPAGDSDALVEAIQSCFDTPHELLNKMGDSAYETARKAHNIYAEAAKLAKLFGPRESN